MGWLRFLFSSLLVGLLLASSPLFAQPSADAWRLRLDTGALHRWQTDINDGGEVELDAWAIRLGADQAVAPDLRLGLSASYGERQYRFEGETGFGALSPWSRVRELRLSGLISWKADERWNLFAVPSIRWTAEEGADLSDGQTGGLIAAASYRVSDRLSIGPGFGIFSGLEDDVDWFPILAIDWRLTDSLALRTGSGFAATEGPGLVLAWQASERWSLSLGARYEKARFRLDDKGVAAAGVGQETAVPVYLGATRSFGSHLSLSLVAGIEFDGELRLEDANGGLIEKSRFDPAPFGGATLDLRF
ncbi:MAG: hypothetical protein VBE63_18885 [Lamprobacter sp.]|uniref:hypothetical protein n=1 Tax=Lamprobacter sp. TaxID=3100796 RepID=UPI002B258C37|nr:hypothetical protein [Lamprobacter sp.]MEA3641983.1 hypothetical protein [Lamprobacter sp.]